MTLTTRRLFVAIFLAGLVAIAARNVTDPDFGWHLRTGELIATTHAVPHVDSFSFTAAGQPRVTHEWLSDLLIYALYQLGGIGALVLFFALAAAAALTLVYARCEGKPFLAAFVTLAAAFVAAPFWGTRPQTISLLLASLFLYILDGFRKDRSRRRLVWLVPLTLLWANMHGSFVVGPILVGVYLAGDIAERVLHGGTGRSVDANGTAWLAGVLVACLAVIAVNPYGLELYVYPFQTVASPTIQTLIQEWQPPDFSSSAIWPFLAFLLLTVAATALTWRRIGLVQAILLVGLTVASLRAARQISLWALVAAPVLAASATELVRRTRWGRRPAAARPLASRAAHVLNWALFLVVALAVVIRIGAVVVEQPQAEREYFPVKAVDYLGTQGNSGPIFNSYNWGGYLIWRMYPRERVFIDGRSDLYGLTDDTIVKEYLRAYLGSANWREPLERYAIQTVLVEPDAPLATVLASEPGWAITYRDSQAVVIQQTGNKQRLPATP